MKNFKRFVVIILTICAVLVCASCKKCSKNTEVVKPAISNQDNAFIKIGSYTITNKQAYNQLLNSYGLEVLLNIVDDSLLPAVKNEAAYKEYLDGVIYGTEEPTEEAFNKFIEDLPLLGLNNDPNSENYYDKYYRLSYRRTEFAISKFEEKEGRDSFEEDQIKAYFESEYRKTNDLIIIKFDSNKEANYYLEKYGVNLNNVNAGWTNNEGTKYTDDQIQAIFEKIYKDINSTEASGLNTYTYEDLTNISSSLAAAAYNWEVGNYTKLPATYNQGLFLVYKDAESKNLDKEGNEVTFEAKKEAVIDLLIKESVDSYYTTYASVENQLKAGIKIYDQSLENFYKLTYETSCSSIGLEEGEYTAFAETDEQSENLVFSYTVNGAKKDVKADELYAKLQDKYGVYLAALYLKQFIVLKDNGVYDYTTDTILNQDKYNSYVEADITEYKEAFEAGDYASLGYTAEYGWENFVRDYLGLTSENQILVNLDSTLYKDALDDYKETLYLIEEKKEGDKVVVPADAKVQDKMEEIYNAYFNSTAIAMTAYYDKDFDGKADEVEAGSAEAQALNDLLSEVYKRVASEKEAIATVFNDIMLEYKLATKYSTDIWGKYKAQGLKLAIVASATYNASSDKDEAIIEHIKAESTEILSFKVDEEKVSLSGQDLSNGYKYTTDKDVTGTVRAHEFVSLTEDDNDILLVEGTAYLYFVTKTTKPYYINSTNLEYKPTRANYLSYLKDTSNVTTAVKNCLTTYYIPAVNELTTDTIVNNALMDDALELLAQVEFANKTALQSYINLCKEVEEAE